MKYKIAVTFEYDERPPDTWRGTIEGGLSVAGVVAKAIRQARAHLKPRNWRSLVAVVLERGTETNGASKSPQVPISSTPASANRKLGTE